MAGQKTQKIFITERSGFGLIDGILSLLVVGIMIGIYGGLVSIRRIDRNISFRTQASALADQAISAIRRVPYSRLSDQPNGPVRNVLYNFGTWKLSDDGGSRVLELAANSAVTNGQSGQMLLPAGSYGNGTLQTSFKVLADSPNSSWSVGFLLRASDNQNAYRIRLAASGTNLSGNRNFVIEKIVNNVTSVLYTPPANISWTTGNWNILTVTTAGDATSTSINVALNGTSLSAAPIADAAQPFAGGTAALIGWNGVHTYVDTVSELAIVPSNCSSSPDQCWNFDGLTELPAAWIRFGANDLPDTTPNIINDIITLSLTPYPAAGSTGLKLATVTVSWNYGGIQTFTSSTLVGNSGLGI